MDSRKREYLDKIVMYLFEDTDFEYVPNDKLCRVVVDTYFTTDCFTDWTYYDHTLIQDFCMGDYGLNEDEVKYVWREYNKMIFDKVREIININRNLNESIETNNRFLDKVVESLINDTNINTKLAIILYPPINFYSSHMSLLLPSEKFYEEFADYCNKHYGITPEEFDIVWGKYSKIMFDKFDVSDNVLKESDDRRKNYLDKVLEFILSDTQIESDTKWSNWINIFVPFTHLVYSRIMHFDREDFFDYCRDTYGLTKDESYSVWEDYINEVNQILINEWGIKDPIYH
jgi:hypothetical protein